jgi:mRNA-degrading endonuclease HigB of HigAB toxin-antitoxin module
LKSLQEDLNLRHRVEVHEVEERKNLHLNQLVRAHEEAFAEIKTYYNNITRANLELITTLKAQITEANEKQAANQKMMVEIAEENKRLSGPLQRATAELNSLQSDLKDTEKDKQSLEYAKTRLRSLRSQVSELEHVYADTERKYAEVESERDELYAKFEATVRLAQAKGEARQEVLESNLAAAEQQAIAKRLQVEQVISAAKLDPHVLVSVADKLDSELETRARTIRDLQSGISRLAKAHDDALRVFFSRMREYDVPEEVIQSLPVSFMGAPSSGPAGLVAKPPIA